MADDPEGRFKRAMDRLFSSPARLRNAGQDSSKSGSRMKPALKTNTWNLFSAEVPTSEANLPCNLHRVCRPWDRGDLFRRLSTFKSMTWFGKPEVAGPVICARNGWVNVDVDLIACEGCNAMLSFPCPPTWSQHEADSAAASFSEKLESRHAALCPWKGNACSETLAQFPPTSVEALANSFHERCDALYQLSALPVLSSSAIDHLKGSRGPQIERFLSQPASNFTHVYGTFEGSSAITYFQAQKIISLCGWELRLLPYVVDCEDDNAESLRFSNSSSVLADSKAKDMKLMDSGPRVLLYSSKKQMVDQHEETLNKSTNEEQKCDLGSAVLDCSLCGASVGLWPFSKIPRPSQRMRVQRLMAETESAAGEYSAASEMQKSSCDGQREATRKVSEDVATSNPRKVDSKPANVLTLKLTIAGGPRPTALPQPVNINMTKASNDYDIQEVVQVVNARLSSDMVSEGKCENDRIIKKRKWNEIDTNQREAISQSARILPCLSSVNAVDTCFASRPENSAESVEMPSNQQRSTLVSIEDTNHMKPQCSSDDAVTEAEIPSKEVVTCDHRSNLTPNLDSEHGIERTASALEDANEVVSNAVFEERSHKSGKNDLPHDGGATSLHGRISMEGTTREHESFSEALHPPERSSSFKELFDESTRDFDPILQHRHFCPWVNMDVGKGGCGWQLTLDALDAAPVAVKSESASSMYNVNPLSSVRKIFGNPKKAGKHQ